MESLIRPANPIRSDPIPNGITPSPTTMKKPTLESHEPRVTPRPGSSRSVLPMTVSVLLTLSSILSVTQVQAQGSGEFPFFREDFKDGNTTDGVPARWEITRLLNGSGSGGVVDGTYVLRTTGGRQSLLTDSSRLFDDVSVRAVVRAMDGTSGTIMVVAHGQLDGRAYMASIGDHGIALWVSRGAFPIPDMINSRTDPQYNPFTQDMNVQFDVVGRKMSLTAWPVGSPKPEAPQISGFAGSVLPPGRVGINTGIPTVLIQSIDAIRIGNSLPPAPTSELQLNASVVIHGMVGMHYRVEFRNGLAADDSWWLLEDIPSLPQATYTVHDPTPVSSNPSRVYQVVLVP